MNVNIPKIIRFCWFGKGPKPEIFEICLKSWQMFCPDFEIRLWNEENSELDHPFVKKCYQLKKWAFVSDYVRLKALYEHGGIYLDIDMLLIKNMDSLLKESCFFGAESGDHISCGIIGSRKHDPFIKSCLKLQRTNPEMFNPTLNISMMVKIE